MNIDKLKQIIQEANPEITNRYRNTLDTIHPYCSTVDMIDDEYGYLEKAFNSITLADVLIAIEKENPAIMVDISGRFLLNEPPFPLCQECSWNLEDNSLDNQSDETKEFLINLLVK